MLTVVIPFFLLLSGLFVFGQHALSGSLQHSVYTYVYRVSERGALELYESGLKEAPEKYWHTLTDSFATLKDTLPILPAGKAGWVGEPGELYYFGESLAG